MGMVITWFNPVSFFTRCVAETYCRLGSGCDLCGRLLMLSPVLHVLLHIDCVTNRFSLLSDYVQHAIQRRSLESIPRK